MVLPAGAASAWLSAAQLASCMPAPGRVLVAGYASLMDEASARQTTPSLSGFRLGVVDGHCRVFNLVSIINIRRGLATGDRLATCTAVARPGSQLRVCLFDIPLEELPALAEREARLRLTPVPVLPEGGAPACALLCLESSDEEYRERWCADETAYHEQVGQYYEGALYRDDLLPVPSYLLRCLRAHDAAGTTDNFLDASFLGGGRISLRAHLLGVVARGAPERGSTDGGWSDDELEEVRTQYLSVS